MKYHETKTCSTKCRSVKHAQELIGLITKTNDVQILLSGLQQCWNCHKIHDEYGRYLLHMAASCGRTKVVEWLVKYKKAELQLKTFENGWTPAHCAAFYGHIDSLISLIKCGVNLIKNDHDRLTPLEHLSLDKWLEFKYQPDIHDDFDLYSWGSNENFNLGNGHEMKKTNAEIVEFFKKIDISIIQIVMSKFHTVFLSKSGDVYTCGFGIDGRLGHDNEITLVAPKQVEQLKNQKIVQIAASRNNTYFLTSDSILYSCGTNEFKQLGQPGVTKSLSPKQVNLGKRLKGKVIKQIECSRFHCVLLTTTNEVFTFGLNAGQLGHPNEMVENATSYNNTICYLSEPRLITSLNDPDMKIDLISCSDGCTVCLQLSKNIIYIFNDYKCRRLHYIKETNSPFKKIRVHGGKLDHFANPDLKWIEDLGDPLLIVGLTESNSLFIWREQDSAWRQAIWNSNKKIQIADFDFNIQGLILCTVQGVCYKAHFPKTNKSSKILLQQLSSTSTPPSVVSKETQECSKSSPIAIDKSNLDNKCEILELNQVPFVNRCFQVVCDKKARNFFALQYHPNTNMRYYPILAKSSFSQNMQVFLNENISSSTSSSSSGNYNSFGYTSHFDTQESAHDIELKYRSSTFCLNKFILMSRSPKFFLKIDLINTTKSQIDLEQYLTHKYSLQSLEILINYIYTAQCTCDFIRSSIKKAKINSEDSFQKFLNEFKELAVDKFGLSELKSSFESQSYVKNLKELHLNGKSSDEKADLMAEFMFKLINELGKKNKKELKLNRNSYAELYDCQIECNNSQSIRCHKCILIARSDYFRNMLLGSWIESGQYLIQLPFDMDLMQILVDYLYSDEIQMDFIHSNTNSINNTSIKSKNEREIEILFNLYVLSDQLLVERLKNLCEFKLANLVNLKNIIEIFEFSHQYDAKQLKEFCMEFISCNLVTLIEAKQLESVDSDLLKDLSVFYRSYFSIVGSRIITPYSEGLEPDKIDLVPIELLYDQKFLDSNLDEEFNKKKLVNSPPFNQPQDEVSTKSYDVKESSPTTVDYAKNQNDTNAEDKPQSVNDEKWEKVKKKNRRKTSEKEVSPPVQPAVNVSNINAKTLTPTTNHAVNKQSSTLIKPAASQMNAITASSPPFISNFDSFQSKKNLTKGKDFELEQWPSLADSVENKKNQKEPTLAKKPIDQTKQQKKPAAQISSKPIDIDIKKPKEESSNNVKPWGDIASNENSNQPKFTLLDVMNQELKKLNMTSLESHASNDATPLNSPPTNEVCSPASNFNIKGWNMKNLQNQTSNNSVSSIAKIIEMEELSKVKYKKLKNRPLSSIQQEEKAIEDLKKLYDIENITNMTIRIELIDEEDFKDCIPVWKTK